MNKPSGIEGYLSFKGNPEIMRNVAENRPNIHSVHSQIKINNYSRKILNMNYLTY